MNNSIGTVVFDVGNVLLDWDPRHLYRKLIPDAGQMEAFLAEICTPAWNMQQDLGRSWKTATDSLIGTHPDKAALIRAFDERWEETVAGPIAGSVALLQSLSAGSVPLYAITNFSAEKFPLVTRQYDFFGCFQDIVVSGTEKVIKPGPEIYSIFFERSGRRPETCLFIDDSPANVAGARAAGMAAHHFTNPQNLRAELEALGLPVGRKEPAG